MNTYDPTAYRNITQRDREFNITVVATAMRAATDTEMWDLWQGYRNALGWKAASEMWTFAAWRRSSMVLTTDACANVARMLRTLSGLKAQVAP